MIFTPEPKSNFAFAFERVRAVTLKLDVESVLTTVSPVLPVAPATATFLISEDIFKW